MSFVLLLGLLGGLVVVVGFLDFLRGASTGGGRRYTTLDIHLESPRRGDRDAA